MTSELGVETAPVRCLGHVPGFWYPRAQSSAMGRGGGRIEAALQSLQPGIVSTQDERWDGVRGSQ